MFLFLKSPDNQIVNPGTLAMCLAYFLLRSMCVSAPEAMNYICVAVYQGE